MKNVFVLLFVVFTTLTFAQKKQGDSEKKEKLTSEQKVELQLKKMTLDLNLNEKQQKDLKPLLMKQSKSREESITAMKEQKEKGEKLSADQRFEMKKKRLDEQIVMKAELKKILNEEQMKNWETSNGEKKEKMKGMREHKKEKRGDNK